MNDELIFDEIYHCWFDDKYMGTATWINDKNVGKCFIRMAINDTGELVHCVIKANKWKKVVE